MFEAHLPAGGGEVGRRQHGRLHRRRGLQVVLQGAALGGGQVVQADAQQRVRHQAFHLHRVAADVAGAEGAGFEARQRALDVAQQAFDQGALGPRRRQQGAEPLAAGVEAFLDRQLHGVHVALLTELVKESPSSLLAAEGAQEQRHLAGMVGGVVDGAPEGAADVVARTGDGVAEALGRQAGDDRVEILAAGPQGAQRRLPRLAATTVRRRRPVACRLGTLRRVGDAAGDHLLPAGDVQHDLPDRVSAGDRPRFGRLGLDAGEQRLQRRPLPRVAVEHVLERLSNPCDLVHSRVS